MKFYRVTEDIKINFSTILNKGDVICNSFYFGWVKCATNNNKTEHFWDYLLNPLECIETEVLKPLDKWDLVKLAPHLKKEMLKFDYPFSLKNDELKTLEEVNKVKERVRKYQEN